MANDDNENQEGGELDQDAMADEWAAAMQEQEAMDSEPDAGAASQGATDSMALDELESEGAPREVGPELDLILDIPVSISMEVGSTAITIRNLLQLNQGSVIELDRLAGEPLDVKVNGTLIAHGEVVVVNEKFGIRMTDVISPSERIKKLR
ncbi:flagellar motor switch protein FliN [Gilvimarinus xylanilyticus]|uniref:Flagellar motor switch protein FliN n=1 Tax=Gilvimarinus xylanilyticus TaxID=2944139 RepID=A0A9X2KRZ4_9GAMM|nr:flagellar motor switch protein FliN [Gilvimarinus xylanilyticus]MCP8898331.1 flagellar motor switch protein FliN [Gilvimarinus xylanilyticus]